MILQTPAAIAVLKFQLPSQNGIVHKKRNYSRRLKKNSGCMKQRFLHLRAHRLMQNLDIY